MESIKKRAQEHKMTLMVGRSHGIHGEPITFGLTLAVWYDEMKRHLKNLKETQKVISVGQISGAMGNFAHAPLELEELTCKELGLKPAPASNQVIQRDRYARLATALALMASSIEKFAIKSMSKAKYSTSKEKHFGLACFQKILASVCKSYHFGW